MGYPIQYSWVSLVAKGSSCNTGDPGLIPGSGRSPERREGQLTPVFLLEELHGQRSLVGYSPWGSQRADTTEQLPLLSIKFINDHGWRV